MNVLITGATGLIGTSLIAALRGRATIVAQSRTPHETSDGVRWIEQDLLTGDWTSHQLPQFDVVYHLAAQTSTYAARRDPLMDLEANVVAFIRLLEFLRAQSSRPFVVLAGTVTEAGLTDRLPISEEVPDHPVTFYDISKLTADLYLRQYVREGWFDGCTLRLANVFGGSRPGQQRDRGILDRVFAKAAAGERVTVYGDGEYLRDYVYIDDVVSALLLAPSHAAKTTGRSFTIGSGRGTLLKDAFAKVVQLARPGVPLSAAIEHVMPPSDLSEIERRNAVVDASAFSAATGWQPVFNFEDGLAAAYTPAIERPIQTTSL